MTSPVERGLFASRWLLLPFLATLLVGMAALLVKAGQTAFHVVTFAWGASETELALEVLSLVDATLVACLLLIVMFSGYENFVSRVDTEAHGQWPAWMTRIDFTGLKLKLMSTLAAIAAVQVLRLFIEIKEVGDREIGWSLAMLGTLVVSGLLMALSDRLAPHEDP